MGPKAGTYVWVVLLVGILAVGVACTKAPDDSQMTTQIQSKLSQDSGLQDKAITVQTSSGVVTLSGTVENDAQRTAAARYASEIPGVKQVVNNLQIMSAAGPAAPAPEETTTAPEPARPVSQAKTKCNAPADPGKRSGRGRNGCARDCGRRSDGSRNNPHPPPLLLPLRPRRRHRPRRRRLRFLRVQRWRFVWWMQSTLKRHSPDKPFGRPWTPRCRARVTRRFLPDMTCKDTWWM